MFFILFSIIYIVIVISIWFGAAWLEGKGNTWAREGRDLMPIIAAFWIVMIPMVIMFYIFVLFEDGYNAVKKISSDKKESYYKNNEQK